MKKLVLIAAVVFAVSVAGGVGGRLLLAPAGGGASASASGETAVTAPPMPKDAVHAAVAGASDDASAGHETSAAPAEAPARPAVAPAPARTPEARHADAAGMEFQEMARILSAMKPDEAVMFLGHLDDAQVLGILRSMSVRDAAGLLHRLPADRANALRRRLLDFTVEAR
jgi:hypothetical protein